MPLDRTHRSSLTTHRRGAIAIGTSGFLGLTLAELLRAEEQSGKRSRRSIINIHLDGGPPQHDTIDPKPAAPLEIRGEFKPIATSLTGLHVSELMPRVASIANKLAFIRSLVGSAGAHDAFQCQSGFAAAESKAVGGRPALGSVVHQLTARPSDTIPAFIDLMQGRPLVRDSARPGFLGPAAAPFRPDMSAMFKRQLEPGMVKELAARGPNHTLDLALTHGLSLERIRDRQQLLHDFDQLNRQLDASGTMNAMDQFGQQALSILSSGKLAEALNFQAEPEEVRRAYTPALGGGLRSTTSEDETSALKLLLARRLIEAGARCVSVSFSDFDTHSRNFPRMKNLMPIVDHALHALYVDLDRLRLLDEVVVVAWGEFGRTPKINAEGGRDHWPEVGPAILFGGGIRGGQVIGATDRLGAKVVSRPVSYQSVFATLYHCLGINPAHTTLVDPTGRPQHLLNDPDPIAELI